MTSARKGEQLLERNAGGAQTHYLLFFFCYYCDQYNKVI